MTDEMQVAITKLLQAIRDDYAAWQGNPDDEKRRVVQAKMRESFNETLTITEGQKYIKVISDDSAWGFVVNNCNDRKFRYGDILKSAGWATPARNAARGNVFEDYQINWTGPNYLRC
jgi:hypothetical protein